MQGALICYQADLVLKVRLVLIKKVNPILWNKEEYMSISDRPGPPDSFKKKKGTK